MKQISSTILVSYLQAGPLKAAELVKAGFSRSILSRAAAAGVIERVGNGHYMLPDIKTSEHHNWALLSARIPNLTICLYSAASFHGTTQNLAEDITCAVPLGNSVIRAPSSFPVPVKVLRWNEVANPGITTDGIQSHEIDGVTVRVTSLERTLVDMFRYSEMNPSRKLGTAIVGEEDLLDCMFRTMGRDDVDQDLLFELCAKAGYQDTLLSLIKNTNFAIHQAPAA